MSNKAEITQTNGAELSALHEQTCSRIRHLRDGLSKIVECEQGEVSNGQAVILMREIARLTLRSDYLSSENGERHNGAKRS